MYRCVLLLIVSLVMVLGSGRNTARALDEKSSLLSTLPKETTLLLCASDVKALLEKLRKSQLYRLKDHPGVQDLAKRFTGELNQEVVGEIGFDALELLAVTGGELVFAIGSLDPFAIAIGNALGDGHPLEIQPDSIPALLAADVGDRVAVVHQKLETLFDQAEKKGAKREDRDFQGGKIVHLRLEGASDSSDSADERKAGGDREASKKSNGVSVYFGTLGSRVYCSLHRPFLERTMDNKDSPGAESLAANRHFQETLEMTGVGDTFFYVDVKRLTTSIGKAVSATLFAFLWENFDALVFGKRFNNVAVSFSLERRGIRHSFFANNSGASDGLLGLFKADSQPAAPPQAVPAGAKIYTATAFNPDNLKKIINAVFHATRASQGQPVILDQVFEEAVGVTLTMIAGALGNRVVVFSGAPQHDACAYLVAINDEALIKRVLDKVAENPSFDLQVEKVRERNIYSLDLGEAGEVVMVVVRGRVIVAGSKAEILSLIGRQNGSIPGLAGADSYKKVAGVVPPQVAFVFYTAPTYMRSYLGSLVAGTRGLGTDDEALGDSLAAFGRVIGSFVSHGDWEGAGLRGNGWLYYAESE